MAFFRFKLRGVLAKKLLIGTVNLPLVCRGEIKHTKKRLTGFTLAPMGRLARLVPDIYIGEVIILFVIVGTVVTG